jgi:SNF2 family DNA or RNA helicase
MIRVDKHARGIAIGAPEGADRNPEILRVGVEFGDRAHVSQGRLIIPIEAAAEILRLLGTNLVAWDHGLLARAQQQDHLRTAQLRARLQVAGALEQPLTVLNGYPRLANLDPHQVQAVAAIVIPELQGIALFDEQGTGKTITTLAAFDVLKSQQRVHRMLVIAPKSVIGSWRSESIRFLGDKVRVSVASGPSAVRRQAILRAHDILIIGYESAVREEGLLRTVLGACPATYLLVIDESFFIKNRMTARARSVGRLRQFCERALVLCGTPAPNSPFDVINQIDIADRGTAFTGRHISKDRTAALKEIKEGLENAIVLRRLKVDVLPHLPSKHFVRLYVELAPAQRKLYENVRRELISAVRRVGDREFSRQLSSFLARRVLLLQICSNPRSVDPLYEEVPAKLRALDRLLHEIVVQQHEKVVIWSYFRTSLNAIAERYATCGLVRIDGSVTSIEDRISAVDRFQHDSSVRVFLGNAAAAGAGITLTAAHHAIYESFSNQAAHYMQSVDRIHRRGQIAQVLSHILIARETIEDREYARLTEKERAGRELLGDNYSETITRDRFLSDLL